MLVELSVMEQRYQAVLAVVQDGWKVAEVAARLGVLAPERPRVDRPVRAGGLAALADRSHRPSACPHQISAEIEATICELRRRLPEGRLAVRRGPSTRCLGHPNPGTAPCRLESTSRSRS